MIELDHQVIAPARRLLQMGVDAFAAIWQELPGLKWFAFVFRLPVIRPLAQIAYLGFLKWQRHHRARRTGRTASVEAPALRP